MKNYINGYFYKKLDDFFLNIKFKIPFKGITFIMGKSGAGKSTFFKCISGIIKPDTGLLKIKNYCIQHSKKNIFLAPEKRNIGFVFQIPYLFPHLSIIENLKFGYDRTNIKKRKIELNEVINELKLKELIKKKPYNLSGGEMQRLCIGQTLLSSPKILLMDEPLSSQDAYMKINIQTYLKYINTKYNIPILYISHNIKEIKNFSNYLIYIKNGQINFKDSNI